MMQTRELRAREWKSSGGRLLLRVEVEGPMPVEDETPFTAGKVSFIVDGRTFAEDEAEQMFQAWSEAREWLYFRGKKRSMGSLMEGA